MSGLTLTWRGGAGGPPLDASPLQPATLAGLHEARVAELPIVLGNRTATVGELFALRADGPDDRLVIAGATDRFDRLGQGLAGGELIVEGDAGDLLAASMTSGRIEVTGAAGRYAATGMTGGVVHITGDCGDFAGAGLPGGRHGMAGGWLLVGGGLGDRAGDRMRRGCLAAGGGAGRFAGARMIGGTILVGTVCAAGVGYGMRRGTIIAGTLAAGPLATFGDGGVHELGWLRLLGQQLSQFGAPLASLSPRRRRWAGCASTAGLGEVLVAA